MKYIFSSLFILVVLSMGIAFAHAVPVTYSPTAEAVLETTPETVVIRFSERIEQGASAIMVYAPDGSRVDDKNPRVDPNDPHYFSIPIHDSGEGTYSVSWQVVSADDGHFTKGAYVFSVGMPSAHVSSAVAFTVVPVATYREAATIFFELLGEALLLGALALLFVWWRLLERTPRLVEWTGQFYKKFYQLVVVGVFLAVCGGSAYLLFKGLELQELAGSFPKGIVMFGSTVAGTYTLYRITGLIIFFIIFFLGRHALMERTRAKIVLVPLLSTLILIAFFRARVSHAAASSFLPTFSIAVNAIHLLFKELWIGSLGAALVLFAPLFRIRELEVVAPMRRALASLTALAIAGGGTTGAYIVWLHLKSPDFLFTSEWGVRFISLSILAVVLLLVRWANQFVIKDAFVFRGIVFEFIVVLGVLFTSSHLIITTPPIKDKEVFEKSGASEGAHVVLTENAADQETFLVSIHDAVRTKSLLVVLTNQERGIGPNVIHAEERGDNSFVFHKNVFAPPGAWKVELTAERERGYDANVSFEIDYPRELEVTDVHAEGRTLDLFALLSIFAGLGTLVVARMLYARRGSAVDTAA